MGYISAFLKTWGQSCTINRVPAVQTYVSMERAGGGRNPLAAAWRGVVLADDALSAGESITVGGADYLVTSVHPDSASGESEFTAIEANSRVDVKRYTETVDEWGNIVRVWSDIALAVRAHGEAVTAALRQYDPGLLDSTRYVFLLPASCGVALLDRIVWNGQNWQVNAIDLLSMPGLARVQCGEDVRP